jgi:hypothetical protein
MDFAVITSGCTPAIETAPAAGSIDKSWLTVGALYARVKLPVLGVISLF